MKEKISFLLKEVFVKTNTTTSKEAGKALGISEAYLSRIISLKVPLTKVVKSKLLNAGIEQSTIEKFKLEYSKVTETNTRANKPLEARFLQAMVNAMEEFGFKTISEEDFWKIFVTSQKFPWSENLIKEMVRLLD
jgi:hypothetical protein